MDEEASSKVTRKSPYKHPVKQHIRQGVVVHHYERGKGKAPRQTLGESSIGPRWRVTREGYRVTVRGGDIVQGLSNGINLLPSAGQSVTIQRV